MTKRLLMGLALAAALVSGGSAQDAKAVIADASKAIGVDTLNTVQFSATGYDFALGQAPNPARRGRSSSTRPTRARSTSRCPPRASSASACRAKTRRTAAASSRSSASSRSDQTIIVNADTPWVQQLEIWMLPHGFLRAAAARNASVESKTVGGKKYTVVSFPGDNKAKVNGYINDRKQVERVETRIDNPFFGDMPFEALYSDYMNAGGAMFPRHIVQKQGGFPIFDLNVTDVTANAAGVDPASAGTRRRRCARGRAATQAASEKLGDGVYLITGGYAAVAIDFADHITIIETGQSEARGQAVIAEAKRLIPNKPVKYVVNTHSHVDHSSGLRGVVSEGATILTHQINKAYLEKTLSVPHALNPDKAQQNGKKPIVEAVGEKKVLTDGTHVVELHHQTGFGHHDGMLLVYLPKEKVLIEADGYNPQAANATPPNPASPYTLNLLDNIRRLKLDVQRIVPIHLPADNRQITMAELTKWVGRAATN